MSSSFPFIFSPCRYNDDLYVDGGLADNFPILLSQQYEGKALGIYVTTEVNNTNRSLDLMTLPSLFIIHFNLVCMDHIYTTIQDCIVISKPPGGFFNFQVSDDEIMAMFDLGYKECRVPGGCC